MRSAQGTSRQCTLTAIVVFLAIAGLLLVLLNTDTEPVRSPLESLKEASVGLSVQDFAAVKNPSSYRPRFRIYTPYGPIGSSRKPILIFMHGGGWVRGTIEMHDSLTRGLAILLRDFIVVSVDYRLSPMTKFPGAVSDCLQTFKWVIERATQFGGDISRIAISGSSAGGNLAIALTLLVVHELNKSTAFDVASAEGDYSNAKLCAEALLYPVTDYSMNTKSYKKFSDFDVTKKMPGFWKAYLEYPDVQGNDPLASPILASTEQLAGFPPSYLFQAEFDPLLDEGLEFSKKLEAAGVRVYHKIYPGEYHGFLSKLSKEGNFKHEVWGDITSFLREKCGLK